MTQEQREQFEIFKTFVRKWINEDCQSAFQKADSRFLILMGVFNYIEIMGAFLTGLNSSCRKRFETFLPYLGQDYKNLLNLPDINIYDELRCGFSHQFIPKSRKFHLYREFGRVTSYVATDSSSSIAVYPQSSEEVVNCGIIFKNGEWHIILLKLLEDYKNGVEQLIKEVEKKGYDQGRLTIFFEVLNRFNLKNIEI